MIITKNIITEILLFIMFHHKFALGFQYHSYLTDWWYKLITTSMFIAVKNILLNEFFLFLIKSDGNNFMSTVSLLSVTEIIWLF